MIQVEIQKINKDSILPTKANPTDVGFDLYSDEEYVIFPGQRQLIKTGIKINLPDFLELQIRPRSGLAYKSGITVLNTPGTIDPGYTDELKVLLINLGESKFQVTKGMRIAQAVVQHKLDIELVETVIDTPSRGGFGSSGK